MPVTIQRLAGNDLKVPLRSLVPVPDLATIEADYQLLAGAPKVAVARSSADFLRRLPTFIVRLRTVLAVDCADKGRSSPRKLVCYCNCSIS
jgi:hypothetical protein